MSGKYYYSVRRLINRFKSGDQGTASAEAVIWLPVFVFLFALLADTALIFGGQARVMRVLQDANRAMSIGKFTDVATTETFILESLAGLSTSITVKTEVQTGTGVIVSTASIPVSDLTATDLVAAFADFDVTVSAQHLSEI